MSRRSLCAAVLLQTLLVLGGSGCVGEISEPVSVRLEDEAVGPSVPSADRGASVDPVAGGADLPFFCPDGEPVPIEWVCDGFPDCAGGADEFTQGCPSFACEDGSHIPLDWRCDTEADCRGGEDERDCSYYMCADEAVSLPPQYTCDGEADCAGGDDETGCVDFECASGSIPSAHVCDHLVDCADGADEHDCPPLM